MPLAKPVSLSTVTPRQSAVQAPILSTLPTILQPSLRNTHRHAALIYHYLSTQQPDSCRFMSAEDRFMLHGRSSVERFIGCEVSNGLGLERGQAAGLLRYVEQR